MGWRRADGRRVGGWARAADGRAGGLHRIRKFLHYVRLSHATPSLGSPAMASACSRIHDFPPKTKPVVLFTKQTVWSTTDHCKYSPTEVPQSSATPPFISSWALQHKSEGAGYISCACGFHPGTCLVGFVRACRAQCCASCRSLKDAPPLSR